MSNPHRHDTSFRLVQDLYLKRLAAEKRWTRLDRKYRMAFVGLSHDEVCDFLEWEEETTKDICPDCKVERTNGAVCEDCQAERDHMDDLFNRAKGA